MHDYLRSIGFTCIRTKKQLKSLIDWVLEKPDYMSVVSLDHESSLAIAQREVPGQAGIAVVGDVDEQGRIIPEYYYPYMTPTFISSDAHVSYERESDRDGYIGMCEDYRLGMALIFNVHNLMDVLKKDRQDPLGLEPNFRKVMLTAMASDAMVILPLNQSDKVVKKNTGIEKRSSLLERASNGDPAAMEALASADYQTFQNVMNRLQQTDVFTVVESFFMPHGMESAKYYLMGKIISQQLFQNPITGEKYYRMLIDSNGMELGLAVNEKDLLGKPYPGARIKCHAWLMGELKR